MSEPRSTDIYEAEDRLVAKDERIAELEAENNRLIIDLTHEVGFKCAAEAKLARAKAWADMPLEYENKHGETLDDILSDTEPSLAVAEGYAHLDTGACAPWSLSIYANDEHVSVWKSKTEGMVPVTVIVMARKEIKAAQK